MFLNPEGIKLIWESVYISKQFIDLKYTTAMMKKQGFVEQSFNYYNPFCWSPMYNSVYLQHIAAHLLEYWQIPMYASADVCPEVTLGFALSCARGQPVTIVMDLLLYSGWGNNPGAGCGDVPSPCTCWFLGQIFQNSLFHYILHCIALHWTVYNMMILFPQSVIYLF